MLPTLNMQLVLLGEICDWFVQCCGPVMIRLMNRDYHSCQCP